MYKIVYSDPDTRNSYVRSSLLDNLLVDLAAIDLGPSTYRVDLASSIFLLHVRTLDLHVLHVYSPCTSIRIFHILS